MKINGADALIGALKKSANLDDIKNVVKANGSEMQKNAMRKSAVDTGFMKRGIAISFEDGGMTAVVKSTAEYSAFVNYGTRFQSAQPFMTPAFYEQRIKFVSDMKRLMK